MNKSILTKTNNQINIIFMKKYISFFSVFFFCLSLFAQTQNDPVLMIINDEIIVTKSEFEHIYNKNNTNDALDRKTLMEYALLFADLKIKVAHAKAQGLDTTATFIEEFRRYRTPVARQYLTDRNVKERLIQEAYDRLKEEINVSHILIRIEGTDTLPAHRKAMETIRRLRREDFTTVAREVSHDRSSAEIGGRIGYVTGFQTVLQFEEAVYSLPVGGITQQPVRSRAGYHIIKVNNRRPSRGTVQAAHIMIMFPNNPTAEDEKAARLTIDSIYNRLKAGEDFGELAREKSQHAVSAGNGGELGWIGVGSGTGENFENAAFALNVGEFSAPVKSTHGFHIIKVLDKRPLAPLEERLEEIRSAMARDGRATIPLREFKRGLREEYNLRITQPNLTEIRNIARNFTVADSAFFERTARLNKPLFSFGSVVVNQQEYIDFLRTFRKNRPLDIDNNLDAFIDSKLFEYEDSRLEKKHPSFRFLMQEYRDGMLMFAITSKEVWERAANDTEGLEAFFEKNRHNYTWDIPRFRGVIVHARDRRTARQARRIIENAPVDSIPIYLHRALNTEKVRAVRTERGLFKKGTNAAVDRLVFNTGTFTPSRDFPIVFVAEGGRILETGPDNFKDMRGLVISDYQNYLQQKWIAELREKYPVVLFEDVLKMIEVE